MLFREEAIAYEVVCEVGNLSHDGGGERETSETGFGVDLISNAHPRKFVLTHR